MATDHSDAANEIGDDSAAVIARAQLLLAAGEPSAANHVLDRYLRAHPHDGQALIELAQVLVMQGDADAAERTATEVVDDPRFAPWARAMLAQIIALDPLRVGESLEWSRSAVHALPTAPGLRILLALRLGSAGQTEEALREIDAALALAPDDALVRADLHVHAARALVDAPGGRAEARTHLSTALELDPSNDLAARLMAALG